MARSPRTSSSRPPSGPWRRAGSFLLKSGLVAMLLGLVALATMVAVALTSLPSFQELRSSPKGQMIRGLARDGTVIAALGPSYGQWLHYDEIPPVMVDAMVAVEDRRFYYHPGVDPIGIARATYVNLSRGGNYQGASTITQQLARNIFLTNARKFARKIRE